MSYRLSIITVVYNGENFLPVTFESVKQVKNDAIEYVVVDGASKDQSLELIKSQGKLIDQLISEPDKGIYDAMNKAMAMAKGDYIVFINAGDEICKSAVDKIFKLNLDTDIIYGDAMFVDDKRNELGLRSVFTTRPLPTRLTLDSFKMGQGICHQSFIVKKSLVPSFDLKYRISADYNWMITCIKRAANSTNLELPVANFLHGGVSKQQLKLALKERFWIMVHQFGWMDALWSHFKILIRGAKFYGRNKRID
jgi:glycosyltransferase involved in cell wall biosynthesis